MAYAYVNHQHNANFQQQKNHNANLYFANGNLDTVNRFRMRKVINLGPWIYKLPPKEENEIEYIRE